MFKYESPFFSNVFSSEGDGIRCMYFKRPPKFLNRVPEWREKGRYDGNKTTELLLFAPELTYRARALGGPNGPAGPLTGLLTPRTRELGTWPFRRKPKVSSGKKRVGQEKTDPEKGQAINFW